jgi:hypothetical protein
VQRFLEKGLEGLADQPGRGAHRGSRQPALSELPDVSAGRASADVVGYGRGSQIW